MRETVKWNMKFNIGYEIIGGSQAMMLKQIELCLIP